MREKLFLYLIVVLYSFNAVYYLILSNTLVPPLINLAQDYEWTSTKITASNDFTFINYHNNALLGILETTKIIKKKINNNTQFTTINNPQVSDIGTTINNPQVSDTRTTINDPQDSDIGNNNDSNIISIDFAPEGTGDQDATSINSSDSLSVIVDSTNSNEVLLLINEIRVGNGCLALTFDATLNKLAYERALEISQLFSHTRPDGSNWSTIMNCVDYSWSGENLAYGQYYPSTVVNSWVESASHADNIFNSNYIKTGISCIIVNDTSYWVQLFTD